MFHHVGFFVAAGYQHQKTNASVSPMVGNSATTLGKASSAIPWWNCYNHAIWPRGPRPLLMTDVTQILSQIEHGDPPPRSSYCRWSTTSCGGWRRRSWPTRSRGRRSQATALVHEAYLRLFGGNGRASEQHWDSRGHFFAAAAEAMRRILIENARRKKRVKHGGDRQRVDLLDRGSGHPRRARRTARIGRGPDESGRGGSGGRAVGEAPRFYRPVDRTGGRSARLLACNRLPTLELRPGLAPLRDRGDMTIHLTGISKIFSIS